MNFEFVLEGLVLLLEGVDVCFEFLVLRLSLFGACDSVVGLLAKGCETLRCVSVKGKR